MASRAPEISVYHQIQNGDVITEQLYTSTTAAWDAGIFIATAPRLMTLTTHIWNNRNVDSTLIPGVTYVQKSTLKGCRLYLTDESSTTSAFNFTTPGDTTTKSSWVYAKCEKDSNITTSVNALPTSYTHLVFASNDSSTYLPIKPYKETGTSTADSVCAIVGTTNSGLSSDTSAQYNYARITFVIYPPPDQDPTVEPTTTTKTAQTNNPLYTFDSTTGVYTYYKRVSGANPSQYKFRAMLKGWYT